ncbi:hypothetical protein [Chlamydiifrater phoenicopteri]|uniref:hypothetical protein n=1 Tax=Chlamydiifrater phoenicopteri TaxID=2681469 RepID=UPI001BCB56E5|nr:hypothetical protein [Chlamydiifrater phoenicopteri]
MKTWLACALLLLNMAPCFGDNIQGTSFSSKENKEGATTSCETVSRKAQKKKKAKKAPKSSSNNNGNQDAVPYSFYYPYDYSFYYPETDGEDEEEEEECHASFQDGNVFYECN